MTELLKNIQECKTISDVETLVEAYYPAWIVAILNDYSSDYSHLHANWTKLCNYSNVSPQKIILVKDIDFTEQTSEKARLCEALTRKGYCIRRAEEFVACQTCYRAIPCPELWANLKERGLPVPDEWSRQCSKCS